MPAETITRNQFTYWKSVEVRWGDMDAMGHVNNTVYFVYLESARVELLHLIGARRAQRRDPQGPSLVMTTCDFKRQVVYPATLDVGLRVERIGNRSFEMHYGLFLHGTEDLVATARSVNAWIDYGTQRAIALPDDLRAALAEYQKR
jgi:acyl-CoA thioester hydrolase